MLIQTGPSRPHRSPKEWGSVSAMLQACSSELKAELGIDIALVEKQHFSFLEILEESASDGTASKYACPLIGDFVTRLLQDGNCILLGCHHLRHLVENRAASDILDLPESQVPLPASQRK